MDNIAAERFWKPDLSFPSLSEDDLRLFGKDVGIQDIMKALFSIGSFKAPRPDGFQSIFFQKFWYVLQPHVCKMVLNFFDTGIMPPKLNDTLISLIPKIAIPETIRQFRPIGLCNVTYKIISKILVKKIKPLLNKLVSLMQSSFIPGRQTSDNIVVVQEILHSFRQRKSNLGGYIWKIDLEKAYDRVKWDFLNEVLVEMGLLSKWISLIMTCVSSVSMTVLWNGEKTSNFKPERGLRQGDPLSPYLFGLCMEKLNHMIQDSVANSEWTPVKTSRAGLTISHLFFADDLLLFSKASINQLAVVWSCLQNFCKWSGLKVNNDKFKIMLLANTLASIKHSIQKHAPICITQDLGKYQGVPLIHSRISKNTYQEICSKLQSKLAGWKLSSLSLAGRATLIQASASTIPVYTMQTKKFIVSICNFIDKVQRDFF
ncbi:Ribonuclease H [Quillaja saponaria]|uniref:Ribonuclease H n=1 Tax=Quillaja saponaria TaxID=32244 RepID=A0AAD7L262_QUISA|nr:Ribonuclease H [Quillaja saponaria]